MSRVAKNPIIIPDGVNISVDDKNVTVKGSKGELDFSLSCLLYTSPSPRDSFRSRMPSSA